MDDRARADEISDMRFGMFICWSFSTFCGHEWTPTLDKDAGFFKATVCDTDQWCKTAKEAGPDRGFHHEHLQQGSGGRI
jgi:alpha-L-fucosidase